MAGARGVGAGAIASAHDVSCGGLSVALAECAVAGPERVGVDVELADALRPDALLFGESTGRVVAATADAEALLRLAEQAGVPARRIGETGGARLRIRATGGDAWIDVPLERLREIRSQAIPRRMRDRDPGDEQEAA